MSRSLLTNLGITLGGIAIGAATTLYAILPSQKNSAEEAIVSHIAERVSEKREKGINIEYTEKVIGEEGIREIYGIPRQDKEGLSQPRANLSIKIKPDYSKRNISLEYIVSPEEEIPKSHFERIPLPKLIPWLNDSATSVLLIHPRETEFSLNQKLITQSKADSPVKEKAIPYEQAKKMQAIMYLGQKAFEKGAKKVGIPAAEAIKIMEKIVSVQSKIEEESLRKAINKEAIITRIPLHILDKIGSSPVGREIEIKFSGRELESPFSSWIVIPQIGIGNQEYGFGSLEKRMYRIDFGEIKRSSDWPFDAEEARRRQREISEKLGIPIERKINLKKGETITMILIPPGRFFSEEPKKEKKIKDPFYISKNKITRGQWKEVMGTFSYWGCNEKWWKQKDLPIVYINRERALEFCKKTGLSLPTEKEWEYACRAGTATKYFFGNKEEDRLNYGENSPNFWGIYALHNNPKEICEDEWNEKNSWVYISPSEFRVLKGGGESSSRSSSAPDSIISSREAKNIGFRPILKIKNK
jgi:hypothetical protein